MDSNTTVAVIPARFASTRLPGKPLLDIAGKPMIVRVCERASAAESIDRVIVATDDQRIVDAVTSEGFEAVLTRSEHETGTDRIAEAVEGTDASIVVNVQGDEPLIAPATIDAAVRMLQDCPEFSVATTCEPLLHADDLLDPNVVKVVVDASHRALYFSRAPIPFPRDAGDLHAASPANLPSLFTVARRHTGLYAYRRDFLMTFTSLPPSPLERLERLEQLRALENGYAIGVVEVADGSIGVDNENDLARARACWAELSAR